MLTLVYLSQVLEEGASFWDQNLILRTFVCALAAKFTFALFIAGMFTGNLDAWGLFNLPVDRLLPLLSLDDRPHNAHGAHHLLLCVIRRGSSSLAR
jgi:hypothetical protein